MNCLMNINPYLTNENVYINMEGGGVNALKAFGALLNEKVYVSGFISDDTNLQGVEIFNKRIFHRNELTDKSIVILDYVCTDKKAGVYELNPDLKDAVFIFGAGYVGSEVYRILHSVNKNIMAYVDTDPQKVGGTVNGIEIRDVNTLREKKADEYSLVIAADSYLEIDEIVNAISPEISRFYWSTDDGNKIWIDREMDNCLNLYEINELCNLAHGKPVYLYGVGENAEKVRQYLQLIDLEFGGYLVNEKFEEHEGVQSLYIEEILYEKKYFIIVMEDIENSMRLLMDMGLKCALDFVPIHPLVSNIFYIRKNILDINLGHSFVSDSGYEGFYEYSEQTDKYKIAVLGGSTTDGGVYSFKSWPEILYEKLEKATIYNFGVSAYTSTQEMMKLMRDVLDFHPDMIITYDGYNDSIQKDRDYFSFPYLREIFDFSEKRISSNWWMTPKSSVQSRKKNQHKKDNFNMWVSNIVLMKEICRLHGIAFYAFLQPMLPTKLKKDKKETAIMLIYRFLENSMEEDKFDFRDRIKRQNICEQYDYIFDLSDIFDETFDVYIDVCHVYEKGNEIIAHEIYKRIKRKLNILEA